MLPPVRTQPRRCPVVRLGLSLFGWTASAAPPEGRVPAETTRGAMALKSPDLAGLQGLIEAAGAQRSALAADVEAVLVERERAWRALCPWERLPLRLVPGPWRRRARRTFAAREAAVLALHTAMARTRVRVVFAADAATLAAQAALWDAFAACCKAERIGEIPPSLSIDAEPDGGAGPVLDTSGSARLTLGHHGLVTGDRLPLRVRTGSGVDLTLYPGFALLREPGTGLRHVLDPRAIGIAVGTAEVVEPGIVPSDACVVGHAWKHGNRDGSPDRRFKDNRRHPVVRYGTFRVTTPLGPVAEMRISDVEATLTVGAAIERLQAAMDGMAREPPPDEPTEVMGSVPFETGPGLPPLPNIGRGPEVAVAAGFILALGLAGATAALRRGAAIPGATSDPPVRSEAAFLGSSTPTSPPAPSVETSAAALATGSIPKAAEHPLAGARGEAAAGRTPAPTEPGNASSARPRPSPPRRRVVARRSDSASLDVCPDRFPEGRRSRRHPPSAP